MWQPLWEAQRTELFADLGSASRGVQRLDFGRDEVGVFTRALAEKMISPVAAAIGAALLLRGGALEALLDWPRNLSNMFPSLSEGPVLWAETILRRQRNRGVTVSKEAFSFFLEIGRRGPPLLGPVLQMAAQQLQAFSPLERDGDKGLSAAETITMRRIRSAMEEVGSYLSSDGLFAAFSSDDPNFSMQQAIGSWAVIRSEQAQQRQADLA
jgi:hypothetical protein